MEWTTRFYMRMANVWQARRDSHPFSRGHHAYANEQIAMWNELGQITEAKFCRLSSYYTKIWQPVIFERFNTEG